MYDKEEKLNESIKGRKETRVGGLDDDKIMQEKEDSIDVLDVKNIKEGIEIGVIDKMKNVLE